MILFTGNYPQTWCDAIICPLFKQGSVDEVRNYRGIALLSVVGKIFNKVLNVRLTSWANENNLFNESQAGFRRGFRAKYCTVDQIFTLQGMIQKYISKKRGRFYALFVDFSRAFDGISQKLLWYKLHSIGLHGDILAVLKKHVY